jgi:hypothetical protein
MSKFLLNLLLQISKALVNSKIQFLIWKFFFLISAPPTLRPTRPLAQPAHWLRRPRKLKPYRPAHLAARRLRLRGKYVFPFGSRLPSRPPLPCLSVNRAPDVSSIPHLQPPELTRLHFPSLKSPLKPSPSLMALKPLTLALNSPARPPRCSPGPL